MGKRNRNVNKFAQRKRDRREQEKNPQPAPSADARKHYDDIVKENAAFEEYYKGQNICPPEEWETFMKSIRDSLPTAFRITGSKAEADALLKIIKSQHFSEIINYKSTECDGGGDDGITPFQLPWYWTCVLPPGSKTAQLIEFLHADEENMPTGFVMANDVDNSRCYMLVHQAKRLNSPCILITNHDSAFMPSLTFGDDNSALKFDRVLCDVPCSGDGTLRKNPDIWMKWSVGNGNNLHGIQYRILKRGAELLALNGRIVYSTCSFNPIENEAVIHRLLSETGDSLQLVDVSSSLPGLVFHKGVTHWRPASKDMVFYDTYEDVPEKWQTVVRPQMFPPNKDDLDKYHLDRCIRILPHQQDTGGFFTAVLEKKAPLPWEKVDSQLPAEETPVEGSADTKSKAEPPKKRSRMSGYREDPFVFFGSSQEDVFPSIKEFYGLSDEFDATCLLTRCHVGKKKNIYLVSPLVKQVVQKNEGRIKIINTGVKTFVRCDNKNMKCAFRLSQEGLQSIHPYLGEERKVKIKKEDLIIVLQNDNPSSPPDLTVFTQETQDRVKDFATGSCVLVYEDEQLQLELVGWRGVRSLRAYTATSDTVHYLRLLGADISKYDVNKFKKPEESENSEKNGSTEIESDSNKLLEIVDNVQDKIESVLENDKKLDDNCTT